MTQTTDLKAIADALRQHDRFLVVTHENPDGDALGSLLAVTLALRQLGKDVVMYLPGPTPLPREYAFMPLDELVREAPADAADRVLLAVDCAKEDRIGDEAALARARLVLDIDHHHDNTRFGDLNLIVADASSTGEVLRDVFAELGVALTPELAEPLYIALVTDTGRFQYANTTPKALRLAAELVEAGADIHAVFQQVYESVEFAKLKLLARALDRAEVLEGGRIVVSHLLRTDFAEVGASEPYSEGLIDYLRAVIIDDSLGVCGDLEADMERHVAQYRCEWQETLADPSRLRRFRTFVNSDEPDPNIVMVPERDQHRPAFPNEKPILKETTI